VKKEKKARKVLRGNEGKKLTPSTRRLSRAQKKKNGEEGREEKSLQWGGFSSDEGSPSPIFWSAYAR